MPILTKEVEVIPIGKSISHYKSLGYDAKYRHPLIVKVEDLSKRSDVKIEVLCDICNKNKMMVRYADYTTTIEKTGCYSCKECSAIKIAQTNLKRYGVRNPLQNNVFKEKSRQTCINFYGVDKPLKLKEFQEKMKQTCLERYGVEYASQSKEIQEKIKQTCLEKYGVENAGMSKKSKEKQLKTFRERYGVDNPMELQKIKDKIANIFNERYGVDNPFKSPEIRENISKSYYQNGTQKTSKQQLYLYNLYGGELNYPIKYYDADICLPNERIIIEFDGSGHDLNVKYGRLTREEFNQKEIIRNCVIKREGYKQIRIISKTDKLPNDETLLRMLDEAKIYFTTTNHTWVNYDIDNSRMINAENKCANGVFYNYGNLYNVKGHKTIKEVSYGN